VPESLLLVEWSSIGLWVVSWVSLWVQRFYFAMGWVGLGQSFGGLAGLVDEIGPTDNSGMIELLGCVVLLLLWILRWVDHWFCQIITYNEI